jgi:ATP-dependent protease HslVU (ClpYQ) peptidase subunit
MTTIAFRRGIMACDSQWTFDDARAVCTTKIRRLRNGVLIGTAGDNDSRALERLIEKAKTPAQLPLPSKLLDLRQSLTALVVFPCGSMFVVNAPGPHDENDEAGVTPITKDYWAIGMGRSVALGAMWKGGSAAEAVSAAMEFDPSTGGKIHMLQLNHPKRPKR